MVRQNLGEHASGNGASGKSGTRVFAYFWGYAKSRSGGAGGGNHPAIINAVQRSRMKIDRARKKY